MADESQAITEENSEVEASEPTQIDVELLREKIAEFTDWESFVFNDRLYSVDEADNRDGNYLVDVLMSHDDTINGPRFDVEATAEGLINGLRWTLKLKAGIATKSLETLHQTLVEEVEAGPEEDAGTVVKTTVVEAIRGTADSQSKTEEEQQPQSEEETKEEANEVGGNDKKATETAPLLPISSYKIFKTTKHGEEETQEDKSLTISEITDFVSEGANIIFLRFLIKSNILTTLTSLHMKTIDPNLNITPAIYKKLSDKKESIGGSEVEIYGIERVIECPDNIMVTTNSFFLPSAHLALRQQIGSPTVVKIDSLPVVTQPPIPEEEEEPPQEEEKPAFEKKELNWEEDMMLFSKYLDRKEELKASHLTYIRHHPELKCLLADFLQQLLLRKPDQVLPFAESFFSTFSVNAD